METLEVSFNKIINEVQNKVENGVLERHISCNYVLLGTLLAVKLRLQRLEEENKDREKAIEYLQERRSEEYGNIGV